jgi:hypothetical protein
MINTVYEYGLYDIEIQDESVALLIFYGFHVIINIHEIGGHINIRFQYYISLDDNFNSPKINNNLKGSYTSLALKRDKESGETIEIELFDEVKNSLTIREALFILNKDNYEQDLKKFKESYKACNSKKLSELINEPLKEFLNNLGINTKQLDENDKYEYSYPIKRKLNKTNKKYYSNKTRHPISFYYDNPELTQKFINKVNLYFNNKG